MSILSLFRNASPGLASPVPQAQKELAAGVMQRWQNGEPADARAFLAEHADVPWQDSVIIDLAHAEYRHRVADGEQLDPAEYSRSWGMIGTTLRGLIEFEEILEFNEPLLREPAPQPSVRWPRRGETFLDLRLVEILGRGAFARVFLAEEPNLGGRRVAVKIARNGSREAHTLGRLNHPHIVPVHSVRFDEPTGLTAICMPYLGRATLFHVIHAAFAARPPPSQGRFLLDVVRDLHRHEPALAAAAPPNRWLKRGSYLQAVIHLGRQLAGALAAAHAQGILHLDVKPSNVLIDAAGRPMLLDFNLADLCAEAKQGGGTLPYASPEQVRIMAADKAGDVPPVDARSDIFSLGVTLYELLTGKHPFGTVPANADPMQMAAHCVRMREASAESPSSWNLVRRIDAPLAAVLERCLAFRPEDRFQTAGELAQALAAQLTPARRGRRWVHAHRVAVSVAAALVVACSAAGIKTWSEREPYPVREFRRGAAEFESGRYPAAIACFNRALESDATYVPALIARGRAFQERGDFASALRDYSAADPDSRDGRLLAARAYCLWKLDYPSEAVTRSLQAIDAGFATAEVFNNLGHFYSKAWKFDKARESLGQAIARNGNLQAAYHNRAAVELQQARQNLRHDVSSGIEDIQRARDLGPASADLDFTAGCLHAIAARSDSRHTEPAFAAFELAIKHGLNPKEIDAVVLFAPDAMRRSLLTLALQPATIRTPSLAVLIVDPLRGSHDTEGTLSLPSTAARLGGVGASTR